MVFEGVVDGISGHDPRVPPSWMWVEGSVDARWQNPRALVSDVASKVGNTLRRPRLLHRHGFLHGFLLWRP